MELGLVARLAKPAGRSAAVPDSAVIAFADDQVAEERKLAGDYLPDAHHHRSIDIALARGEVAVVREVPERRAYRDAAELVQDLLASGLPDSPLSRRSAALNTGSGLYS